MKPNLKNDQNLEKKKLTVSGYMFSHFAKDRFCTAQFGCFLEPAITFFFERAESLHADIINNFNLSFFLLFL